MTPASDNRGANLLFLVSQPRAGSTVLQRVLGGHSAVHTGSEPWLMLALCEALAGGHPAAAYAAGGWAALARDAFLKDIGGRDTLVQGVRALAHTVYGRALAGTGKQLFLDKTPRYYHILPELAELFPEARLILLLRNPLAVLCSIVRTWVQDPAAAGTAGAIHWERMHAYRADLLDAPAMLLQGAQAWGARARVVRYESLVTDAAREVEALCAWLALPFEPAMLVYGAQSAAFAFGDPTGVHRHREVSAASAARWREDLRDPVLWRLARDYLAELQRAGPDPLGYSGAELREALTQARPPLWRRLGGRPLLRALQGRPLRKESA